MRALALLALLSAALVAGADKPESRWTTQLLGRHALLEDEALLGYLKDQQFDQIGRIDGLIAQLGDDEFGRREQAMRALTKMGRIAREKLQRAAAHKDPEIARRARMILARLKTGQTGDDRLLLAVLDEIERRRLPAAAPLLFNALSTWSDGVANDKAQDAFRACLRAGDARLVRDGLKSNHVAQRCAAVIGLEKLEGAGATPALQKFLQDPDERVALAAVRALLAHRPRQCLAALIDLNRRSRDSWVRLRTQLLLHRLTGQDFDLVKDIEGATIKQWDDWYKEKGGAARLRMPVRLDRLRGPDIGYYENFHQPGEIAASYHDLRRFSNVDSKLPRVTRAGLLRLPGAGVEGDQRLTVSGLAAFGTPTFPERFTVHALIGGEKENAGGWHVGVSIGNIRLLFHPGYSSGSYRAETVDRYEELFPNQNMPYTPAAGVLHSMTIKVSDERTPMERDGQLFRNDQVRFEVAIKNEDGKVHQHRFDAPRAKVGAITRVGLERSGRPGGAALFGPILILPGS